MKKRNLKIRILALTTCTLVLIGALMLPIGAAAPSIISPETVPIPPDYTSPADLSDHSKLNLISFPYAYEGWGNIQNGVTFYIQDDGIIYVNGTSTERTYYVLNENLKVKAGQKYTLSGCPKNSANICSLIVSEPAIEATYWYFDNGNGITFQPKTESIQVYIVIEANQTIYAEFKPMLNMGDVANPYQPHLSYFFQQAYDEGWVDSYYQGYLEGQEYAYKNVESMKESIFDTALYESTTTITTTEEIYEWDIVPNQTKEGIYFQNLRNSLINGWGENYIKQNAQTTYLKMSWPTTWNWSTQSLFIQGNNLVRNAILETTSGKKYTLTASGSNSDLRDFIIQETNIEYPIEVKSITIIIDNPYDLLNSFTLLTSTKEYNLGYTEGYAKGATDNDDQQYQYGYTVGKKDGFLAGKEEGLQITNTGSWTNLFTAVAEAPINTFQSLFNFEILGLDMRVAFGAIMSICVLLIIIKKVIL